MIFPMKATAWNTGWLFRHLDSQENFVPVTIPHDAMQAEPRTELSANGINGGWYEGRDYEYIRRFTPDKSLRSKTLMLEFEGVYHLAEVYLNGEKIAERPYGYTNFYADLTDRIRFDEENELRVIARNSDQPNSRWYSGAGIYRPVVLWTADKQQHIALNGVRIRTVSINPATVEVAVRTVGAGRVSVDVLAGEKQVASAAADTTGEVTLTLTVPNAKLWDVEHPNLYTCRVRFGSDEDLQTFGIRTLSWGKKGILLNGERVIVQGACIHHDQGILGARCYAQGEERRVRLLKENGYNAVRSAHNPCSKALLDACDRLGMLMMDEYIDHWYIHKTEYDYVPYFDKWWKQDIADMVDKDYNHPCVILYSTGNEVSETAQKKGIQLTRELTDYLHSLDNTRPVTCGMDQVSCVLANGFAAMIDIPGLNYRANRYQEAYSKLPQNLILGSETASTVSSRGVYKFPVEDKKSAIYDDHQCSSYDVEACSWSNIPDEDFALADDYHWTIGQFVWTGFDYLGEPSPYDTNAWPNHSSMFGIIDLASLPKDRYYLYRSIWNKEAETLHILPHWTWPGREGEVTPVFVYTNYPAAELFINGKSYGKQSKNNSSLKSRYRLMWMDAVYEPGEVKVVAYDKDGKAVAEKVVRTAGKPHHIELVSNRNELTADGKDLAYVTVKVVDKDGNLCPADNRLINFSVKGAGTYRAGANGDPTSLDLFHLPKMHAFNGMLTAIVQTNETAGEIILTAKAGGVKAGSIRLLTK